MTRKMLRSLSRIRGKIPFLAAPATTYIISFPKCGRTWLRLMIGNYLVHHFDLETSALLDIQLFHKLHSAIPRIAVFHDDKPYKRTPDELARDKGAYARDHVVFLVRDPRDVLVSRFYAMKFRESKRYSGDLGEFLVSPRGSLATIVEYYNIWLRERQKVRKFMLVRYEDLHSDPNGELIRIMDFIGVHGINDDYIHQAVQFSSFSKMRRLEHDDIYKTRVLQPAQKWDFRSYKTRKGVIGDHRNVLERAEQEYVNRYIDEHLLPEFGYHTDVAGEYSGHAAATVGC